MTNQIYLKFTIVVTQKLRLSISVNRLYLPGKDRIDFNIIGSGELVV